jgi:hypothetical protein
LIERQFVDVLTAVLSDGLPAPKTDDAPHENDLRMMRFALERLKDIAQAADAFD